MVAWIKMLKYLSVQELTITCVFCGYRKGQKKVVSARKLWFEILNSQTETGTPYMLFHDTVVTDLQLQVGKNRVMCWFRSNPS
jgi:ribonucleoside-diphosphate reductase subunit M1